MARKKTHLKLADINTSLFLTYFLYFLILILLFGFAAVLVVEIFLKSLQDHVKLDISY